MISLYISILSTRTTSKLSDSLPRGLRELDLELELELELILSHMTQKPMLRGEVGARALRVWSVERGGWASAGV